MIAPQDLVDRMFPDRPCSVFHGVFAENAGAIRELLSEGIKLIPWPTREQMLARYRAERSE